jgi:hypothetical protein
MAYVYEHRRLDNNQVFYIGIGSDDELNDGKLKYKRAKSTVDRNYLWYKTIKETDYSVNILFECLSWLDACEKEKELIKFYGRKNNGGILVNLTEGGDGFKSNHTEATKEKISKKLSNKTYEEIHGIVNADIERNKRRNGVKKYWDSLTVEKYDERIKKRMGKGKPHSGNETPIKCPHCDKIGRSSCMVRWHFENCTSLTGKKHSFGNKKIKNGKD